MICSIYSLRLQGRQAPFVPTLPRETHRHFERRNVNDQLDSSLTISCRDPVASVLLPVDSVLLPDFQNSEMEKV